MVARHGYRSPSLLFNESPEPSSMSGVILSIKEPEKGGNLIAPEMKTYINLAAFVQEPAEEGTEGRKDDRSENSPRIVLDHEAGNDIAGAEENGGV